MLTPPPSSHTTAAKATSRTTHISATNVEEEMVDKGNERDAANREEVVGGDGGERNVNHSKRNFRVARVGAGHIANRPRLIFLCSVH